MRERMDRVSREMERQITLVGRRGRGSSGTHPADYGRHKDWRARSGSHAARYFLWTVLANSLAGANFVVLARELVK